MSTRSIIQFLGNKRKSVDAIVAHLEGSSRVVDLFSGSATVGHALKARGHRVMSFDLLEFCHQISKAIVQNSGTTVSPKVAYFRPVSAPTTYFHDLYADKVFLAADCTFLDWLRHRIKETMANEFERALCLAAAASAMVAKSSWGRFNVGINNHLTEAKMGKHTKKPLSVYFMEALERLNGMVIEGTGCMSYRGCVTSSSVRETIKSFNPDAVYLDPPYPTYRRRTSYEYFYHVVETWCVYDESWNIQSEGLIQKERKSVFTGAPGVFREALEKTFNNIAQVPVWVISYASHCRPGFDELIELVSSFDREVEVTQWASASYCKSKWSKHDQPKEFLLKAILK